MKIPMKIPWMIALGALALLGGCIDTSTRITVKPDGSGTIDKTIVISKHLAEFVQRTGMKGDAASIEQGMLNETLLKGGAGQMGSGVSFVSAQKVTTDKGNGYHAVYSFKDISKVKINENPAADLNVPTGGNAGAATPAEFLTFKFAPGAPATLTVIAPKPAANAKPPTPAKQPTEAETEQIIATMKPLYSDLRIVISITVAGKIASTNATYTDGSTVTLTDMDFGKILADDATVKKLAATQAQSLAQVRDMAKGLPDVKLETQDSVTVKFQ